MTSSGLGRIAVAFTAGIALALGGALVYLKVVQRPASVSVPVSPPMTIAGSAVPERLPDAGPGVATAEPAPVKQQTAPTIQALSKPKPSHRRVAEVARNTPPPVSEAPLPASPYPEPAPAPIQEIAPPVQPEHAPEPVAAPPVKREPRTVTIPPGTTLAIRLNETLSTEHVQSGGTFNGTLQSNVILSNALIAERGSRVEGTIVAVQQGGRGEGVSDLNLTLKEITTTDGQRVRVSTSNYDKRGDKTTRNKAEKIGGGAALGAIIGAIAGGGRGAAIGAGVGGAAGGGDVALTRGKAVVLESETPLSFVLNQPVTITEKIAN